MEYFKGVVVKDLEVKWADIQPGNSGDVLVLGNDGSRWTKLEPNSYPQAKESFSKAVWIPINAAIVTPKRQPIPADPINPFNKVVFYPVDVDSLILSTEAVRACSGEKSDNSWKNLSCCGGTCTRGICEFHNCPPEQ